MEKLYKQEKIIFHKKNTDKYYSLIGYKAHSSVDIKN